MNTRYGLYGTYYGSYSNESAYLTTEQMNMNFNYLYRCLVVDHGWSLNSFCGICGNIQKESTFNPGIWQSNDVGNMNLGYGLVQWTPATKYIDWIAENSLGDYSTIDNCIARILYEIDNNVQWLQRSEYALSFSEFTQSEESVDYLARAFMLCYERPKDQSETAQLERVGYANEWYTYITGVIIPPIDPPVTPTNRTSSKMGFVLMNANKRRKTHGKRRIFNSN